MNQLRNTVKTTLFLGALTGLFLFIGAALGGSTGMVIALVLAIAMNMGAWWFSDKLALKFSRARQVTPEEMPEVHRMVEDAVGASRHSQADCARDRQSDAKRLCHGSFAQQRCSGSDHRHHADPQSRRVGGRNRARVGPHQESRHVDQQHRRQRGRCHQHDRRHGNVEHDLRRDRRQRRRGRWRHGRHGRRHGCHLPGPDCSTADSDGHLTLSRVCRRRRGCAHLGQPGAAG